MTTISQCLRELDRKVLREERYASPELWAKAMSRWWRPHVAAHLLAYGAVGLSLVAAVEGWLSMAVPVGGMVGALVALSFQAGQMKAEHDRVTGTRSWTSLRRPPTS